MKPYLTFSAEDLACDDDFLRWVKYPDRYPELENFWRQWLREHEYKREVVEEARLIILAIASEQEHQPGEDTTREVWERIEISSGVGLRRQFSLWNPWYSKAATVLVALGVGWLVSQYHADPPAEVASDQPPSEYVRQINNSDAPKTILLGDGTSIILQPKSVLEFPEVFKPNVREVFLTGQAFFEVMRDPTRPFLVQAGEIVTRVLGTSFTIRNFEGENEVLVQVQTGKVSVFKAHESSGPFGHSDKAVEGVILMPNQQVLYERAEMRLTKSLVENPSVLIPLTKHEFEFVDAPIKEVFTAIEAAYGIKIVFDEEALSNCYLNASLTDVPLYDKLKLICKGINTTYELIDSHIIIYGKGCNEGISNPNPI